MKTFREHLIENSTDDAKKTLDAIVGFLKKQDELDKDGKEILDTGFYGILLQLPSILEPTLLLVAA